MKTRPQLLNKIHEVIAEHERHIHWCEGAMRRGMGPFDIEGTRLSLAKLREWERQLTRPMLYSVTFNPTFAPTRAPLNQSLLSDNRTNLVKPLRYCLTVLETAAIPTQPTTITALTKPHGHPIRPSKGVTGPRQPLTPDKTPMNESPRHTTSIESP